MSVLRFAACLFILAGIYVYEYIRLNFKFLLPSIQTIKKFYSNNPYVEAHFRFNETKTYLNSIQCQFVFISEDCSAIIPKIEYDSTFNSFNGFVTPLSQGIPIENAFQFNSFEQLKAAIDITPRANLVNVHLVQPIYDNTLSLVPPPIVLSTYGTDNKLTSIDILKRWTMMFQQFFSRDIRVIGFSTDGDPKFLRAMRLALNFFVKSETLQICNDNLSFTINIPPSWYIWYFFKPTQLFMCMQDGIHLCNKIRNRLLSTNARLTMGRYNVSIKHLRELINYSNKIDHNLSNSDLNVRDKQNFASCQKICDDKVLVILSMNEKYKGTYNYLLLLNLLIMAYTNRHFSLSTRIFYGWIVVFYVRLWRIWLYITKNKRRSTSRNTASNDKYCFITSNALLAMEINAHCLIYIYLLIEQKHVPQSLAKSIDIFSSQPCENLYRDARALSGIYSSQINFTMKQFLRRINKLNALTEIKQYEITNYIEKIQFPVHHKIKKIADQTESNIIDETINYNVQEIEQIIIDAYRIAQDMATSVGMNEDLIKFNLFELEESSEITEKLLKFNTLNENEVVIVNGDDSEASDEDNFDGYDFGERFINNNNDNDDDYNDEVGADDEDEDEEDDDGDEQGTDADGDEEDNTDDTEDNTEDDTEETNHGEVNEKNFYDDNQQRTTTFENVQTKSFTGA